MSDGVTNGNNSKKRLSSILKKTDANNLNQCDVQSNFSENVEKSQKRKSKRVSFGRQMIQEIDKVSEIHRNWADSLSSDEGTAGLSDIGNLTSLKSKKSLENPHKYEQAEPPKNLSNILSFNQGFKFFDNTNLNIDDEDLDKENATEHGLFARDFLRSHNLIKPDRDTKHAAVYPDVNPPSYNEIMKSSCPMQTDAAAVTAARETKSENEACLYSSKHFIQMALGQGATKTMDQDNPINSQESSNEMADEMLNKTDVDNADMEMTSCIVSQHTMMNQMEGKEAGPSSDSQLGVHEDVEMTCVKPVPTSLAHDKEISEPKSTAVDSSMDDMEITCAVPQSHLRMVASGNDSDFAQTSTATASTEFTCVNPQVLVAPTDIRNTNSLQNGSEDMEFTCFVPLPAATASSFQTTTGSVETDTNRHNSESATTDLRLTTTASQLSEGVMQSNDDDMEFTCTVSKKFGREALDGAEQGVTINQGQVTKSAPSLLVPKLSFDMTRSVPTRESISLVKNFDGDEVANSSFSVCAQSVEGSFRSIVDSTNDSVFGMEASCNNGVTNPQTIDNEEMQQSEIEAATEVQKMHSVITPDGSEARTNLQIDSNLIMSTEDDTGTTIAKSNETSSLVKTSTGSLPATRLGNDLSFIPPENNVSPTDELSNVRKVSKTIDKVESENNFKAGTTANSLTAFCRYSENDGNDLEMEDARISQIHKDEDIYIDRERLNVPKNPCTSEDADKPGLSRGDTIPVETFLKNVGLILPKTSWSRDSVATIPLVEPRDKSLASLFEMKFCTPTQNDIRESAISQIEEILGWCESRIEQMKEESCNLPSGYLKSEVVQRRLGPFRDHSLAQAKVYWKQTKTKLYKGLTKALEEYISTHLEKVCSKFNNAKELLDIATEESHKRETEQRPDAPTAEQEDEVNRLDHELDRLNSEIKACNAKVKITQEYNDETVLLEEDIARLTKEWNDVRKKNRIQQQRLTDFRRVTGRKMSLETEKVLVVDFLNGTIELKVELVEKLSPWDWNSKILSYSFKYQKTSIPSPAEADFYSMIHNWWMTIFPTPMLLESYPNLKSFKTLLRLLADLEEKFKNLISTSDWIASRLVCNYSTIPEEGTFVVSFMPPRIFTDRFQISFSFDQFREGNKPEDVLAVGANPTSYNFTTGPRLWKELQLSSAETVLKFCSHLCHAHLLAGQSMQRISSTMHAGREFAYVQQLRLFLSMLITILRCSTRHEVGGRNVTYPPHPFCVL